MASWYCSVLIVNGLFGHLVSVLKRFIIKVKCTPLNTVCTVHTCLAFCFLLCNWQPLHFFSIAQWRWKIFGEIDAMSNLILYLEAVYCVCLVVISPSQRTNALLLVPCSLRSPEVRQADIWIFLDVIVPYTAGLPLWFRWLETSFLPLCLSVIRCKFSLPVAAAFSFCLTSLISLRLLKVRPGSPQYF